MSILAGLEVDKEIKDDGDSLGGQFGPVESGLYKLTINSAYITVTDKQSIGVVVECKTKDGVTVRETFWVQSGKEKGCKTYFVTKAGDKQNLPGFNQANALCLLTVGKELSKLETEEKIIDLYNYTAKAQVPTKVDMITDLVGKEVVAGIIKRTVNKRKQNAEGKYVSIKETRQENEFNKFFRAKDNLTVTEIKAGVTEAEFYKKWAAKWNGVTQDRTDKDAVDLLSAAAGAAAPTELFS
jgi:hypothetical protein